MSTQTTTGPARVPVILVRTAENELLTIDGHRNPGWFPLVGPVISNVLGGISSNGGSGRYFAMPDDQLGLWDSMTRHTSKGGYEYAMGWRPDGKIGKVFSLKEVTADGAAGLPPLDPIAVATMLAVAQVQASIQILTAQVERVGRDVQSIVKFLHYEQEAEILAAAETIEEVHARLVRGGISETDWQRIAGLEQVVKKQYRQVLHELRDIREVLDFRNVPTAKACLELDEDRLWALVTLAAHLLVAFDRWTDLMLAHKSLTGEASLDEIEAARQRTSEYLTGAREAVGAVLSVTGRPFVGRTWHEQLLKDGIVIGRRNDETTKEKAQLKREEVLAELPKYQLPELEPAHPGLILTTAS